MTRLTLALIALATPLAAQEAPPPGCGDYAEIAAMPTDKYAEAVTGRGLNGENNMIEVWTNPETGTFTIIVRSASGRGCMIAGGGMFEAVKVVRGDPA